MQTSIDERLRLIRGTLVAVYGAIGGLVFLGYLASLDPELGTFAAAAMSGITLITISLIRAMGQVIRQPAAEPHV